MRMRLLGVRRHLALGDVPAAVVAGRRLLVAGVAVERATLEILLEPGLLLGGQLARILRDRQLMTAAVARLVAQPREEIRIMVVHPAADLARAAAEGARRAHLRRDRLADEGALVGEL